MGLIREPKNVDFTVESKPWTEEELADFRVLMKKLKSKRVLLAKAGSKPNALADVQRKKKHAA